MFRENIFFSQLKLISFSRSFSFLHFPTSIIMASTSQPKLSIRDPAKEPNSTQKECQVILDAGPVVMDPNSEVVKKFKFPKEPDGKSFDPRWYLKPEFIKEELMEGIEYSAYNDAIYCFPCRAHGHTYNGHGTTPPYVVGAY
jgi:hypothetical protein